MPRPITLEAGPWLGARVVRLEESDPRYLLSATEMLRRADGTAWMPRPSWRLLNLASTPLGSGGSRVVNLIYEYQETDGTRHSVVVVGGQFYTYNWGTDTFTETITAAQFSSASITLSASSRWSAVTLGGEMVVCDGTNTPWMWDGTGGGGLTLLVNVPIFYGPMVVYYAKLFGIKKTERNVIVWSEENNPALGYEQSGYTNAWALTQTDTDALVGLVSSNEALYYFRETGIGVITGAVTPDFRSTGTRNSIAEHIGTLSPWSPVYENGLITFVDQYRRVTRVGLQRPVEELWRQHEMQSHELLGMGVQDVSYTAGIVGTLRGPNTTIDQITGIVVPGTELLGVLYVSLSGSGVVGLYRPNGDYQGTWSLSFPGAGVMERAGRLFDTASSVERLVVGNNAGYVWALGASGPSFGNDYDTSRTEAKIATSLYWFFGADDRASLHFDELRIKVLEKTSGNVRLYYQTPDDQESGSAPFQTIALGAGGSTILYERELKVGLSRQGRWMLCALFGNFVGGTSGWEMLGAKAHAFVEPPDVDWD